MSFKHTYDVILNLISNNLNEELKDFLEKNNKICVCLVTLQKDFLLGKCVEKKNTEAFIMLHKTGIPIEKDAHIFLYNSIIFKNKDLIRYLLKNCKIEEKYKKIEFVYKACLEHYRDFEILKDLVENGLDVNVVCEMTKLSPMNALCSSNVGNEIQCMKLLLENGADINNKKGFSPILSACKAENKEIIEFLIEMGVTLDENYLSSPSRKKPTVFTILCERNNLELLKIVLKNKGCLNINIVEMEILLTIACMEGHGEILEYIIQISEKKTKLNLNKRYDGKPLIFYCVNYNFYKCTEILLKYGCSREIVSDKISTFIGTKITPICLACAKGDLKMTKILLKHGCDINCTIMKNLNLKNYSCLDLCIQTKSYNMIEFLAKRGIKNEHSFFDMRATFILNNIFTTKWSIKNHNKFPYHFQEKIKTLLLIGVRKKEELYLPKEVLFFIFEGLEVKYFS